MGIAQFLGNNTQSGTERAKMESDHQSNANKLHTHTVNTLPIFHFPRLSVKERILSHIQQPNHNSHSSMPPYLPPLPPHGWLGLTAGTEPGFFKLFLQGWPETTPVVAHLTAVTYGQGCEVVLVPTHLTFLRITSQNG